MPDLDYGYEVTIQTPATSDPAASSVTNQWQRQVPGNVKWDDISGGSNETYKIASGDRSAKVRLQQDLNGAKVYSNELQVTSSEFELENGIDEIGGVSGDLKTWGAVLAPNGKIWCVPNYLGYWIEVDPTAKTTSIDVGKGYSGGKFRGAAMGLDGLIYTAPYSSGAISWLDPETRIFTLGTDPIYKGYMGAVSAPNGKIYYIPAEAGTVGIVNTVDKSFSTIPNTLTEKIKCCGGTLVPNNKIVCAPYGSAYILEIDTTTNTVQKYPHGISSPTAMYAGAVLAPNGKVYFIPYSQTTVGVFDPQTKSFSQFGSFPGQYKWTGGVLGSNGKVYGIPYKSKSILEIDPSNNTAKAYGEIGKGEGDWQGGCLHFDGKIYGAPSYGNGVLTLDVEGPSGTTWHMPGLPNDTLDPLSPYFNKSF